MLIQCERASILSSAVVYIKAPYEMTDQVVLNVQSYGTVANMRRQVHDFDSQVETGVQSVLIKNLKKPIPSFVRVGGFTLPVRYRGQQKTCKVCDGTGHLARDCPLRGRCFVCGSYNHRAAWHDKTTRDDDLSETPTAVLEEEEAYSDEDRYSDEEDYQNEDEIDNEDDDSPSQELGTKTTQNNENPPTTSSGEKEKEHERSEAEGGREKEQQNVQEATNAKEKETENNPKKQGTPKEQNKTQANRHREGKKSFSDAVRSSKGEKTSPDPQVTHQEHDPSRPKPTGFWDEAVNPKTRKRKSCSEENAEGNRKQSRDEHDSEMEPEPNDESESDMDQNSTQKDSTQDRQADVDSADDEFVPYTRHGVQRFRRRRGTGAIATQNRTESSQTSSDQPKQGPSQRGRGRGRAS